MFYSLEIPRPIVGSLFLQGIGKPLLKRPCSFCGIILLGLVWSREISFNCFDTLAIRLDFLRQLRRLRFFQRHFKSCHVVL